jgi:hypothetical protein
MQLFGMDKQLVMAKVFIEKGSWVNETNINLPVPPALIKSPIKN